MSDYEAQELENAIYVLRSMVNNGNLDGLYQIEHLRSIVGEGYIDKLKAACDTLLEAQKTGLVQQLTNFNETSEELSRTIRGYEANQLCEALKTLKPLTTDEGKNAINRLASNLNNSALSTLAQFISSVNMLEGLAARELTQFDSGVKSLRGDISTLTSLVNDLSREVYELRQDREARQRDNINLEIRNYLDLLKDPMMMQTLGITREMIATKLAELLNANGLTGSYVTEVAKEDAKQNTLK